MDGEQFSRLEALLGKDKVERLHKSSVLVVGLGAVGGNAFEALVRCGVGMIRAVDFDTVEESNINRQIIALHSTLGMRKTDAAKMRALDIWPDVVIEAFDTFLDETNCAELTEGMDLVLDCCDSVKSKLVLIKTCQEKGIPIISSMGAALKRDPTKVRVTTLGKTEGCPLARSVRTGARRLGLDLDTPVVFSCERTDFDYSANRSAKEDGRKKEVNLGSLATVTGVFGLTMASWAIERLTE